MSKSHPLKLKDNLGNLQRITSAEKNWLAYQAGLQINEGSIGDLTLTSTGNRLIGSFVDTYYNEVVGTHPASLITSSQTTTNLYQNDDAALENDSDFRLPLAYNNDDGNIYEMNTTNYTTFIDEINGIIHQNDYPSSFKLDSAGFTSSDWTTHISNIFTDTINTGNVKNYSIFKRTSMTEPARITNDSGNNTSLATIIRGDSDMDFDGIANMTDRQAKYSLGQRAATRRGHGTSPGSYQLRSATQGPPTDAGTWVAKGSAINSRREVSGSAYTRTRTSSYAGNYTSPFAGDYVGNYARDFAGNFTGDYVAVYGGNYTGNFIGDYLSIFTGDYIATFAGEYTGVYAGNYTTDFIGDYTRDFLGEYTGVYAGNYTRDFIGNYVTNIRYSAYSGEYTGVYSRTRNTTFSRNVDKNFIGDFTGNFAGNFVGDYISAYTGNYTGNYTSVSNRTRNSAFIRTSQRFRYSSYSRDVDYIRFRQILVDIVGGYGGNYTGHNVQYTSDYIGLSQLTYVGNFTRNVGTGTFTGDYMAVAIYSGNYTGTLGTSTFVGHYTRFNYTNSNPTQHGINPGSLFWRISGEYEPGAPVFYDQLELVSDGNVIYVEQGSLYDNMTSTEIRVPDELVNRQNMHFDVGQVIQGATVMRVYRGTALSSPFLSNGRMTHNFRVAVATDKPVQLDNKFGFQFENYVPFYYTGSGHYAGNYTGPAGAGIIGQASYTRSFSRIEANTELHYVSGAPSINYAPGFYTRQFVTDYTGDYTASYFGDFTGDFIGAYSRIRESAFTRTSTRTSVDVFSGDFIGAYARDRSSSYAGEFTGVYTGDYSRAFIAYRIQTRTSTYIGNYTGVYSRTRTSNYLGNYTTDFVGDYAGVYSRTRNSNFTRDRVSAFTRDSTRISTRNRPSTFTRTSLRTRTSTYLGTYIGNYTGDFIGNYSRSFLGNYTGDTIQTATETAETYTLYVRVA
jgi:hypothetical protein